MGRRDNIHGIDITSVTMAELEHILNRFDGDWDKAIQWLINECPDEGLIKEVE